MIKQTKIIGAVCVLAVSMCAGSAAYAAMEYTIDNAHSTLGFAVRHLVISKTTGQFDTYEGSISYDPESLDESSAMVTIQAASINTQNEGRDKHLSGPDFFDVEQFPTITFKSKEFTMQAAQLVIIGDLTMKGITKEIALPVEVNGPVANPFGGMAIGLEGVTKINRQDWGISWNKAMDAGGVVVSDEVELRINIEAHHKEAVVAESAE